MNSPPGTPAQPRERNRFSSLIYLDLTDKSHVKRKLILECLMYGKWSTYQATGLIWNNRLCDKTEGSEGVFAARQFQELGGKRFELILSQSEIFHSGMIDQARTLFQDFLFFCGLFGSDPLPNTGRTEFWVGDRLSLGCFMLKKDLPLSLIVLVHLIWFVGWVCPCKSKFWGILQILG